MDVTEFEKSASQAPYGSLVDEGRPSNEGAPHGSKLSVKPWSDSVEVHRGPDCQVLCDARRRGLRLPRPAGTQTGSSVGSDLGPVSKSRRTLSRRHERIGQGPDWMASLLLPMDRSDMLCGRALRALASRPEVFSPMLAAHVGETSPASFASAVCSLDWSLLTV